MTITERGPRARLRDEHREALIDAAADLVATDGIVALRALLNVAAVQRRTEEMGRPVPRATAYRLLAGDAGATAGGDATDQIIRALAERAVDPDWSGLNAARAAADEAGAARMATLDTGDPAEEVLIEALRANIESQFSAPGLPVGSMLRAAVVTASPRWEGQRPTDPTVSRLAADIRATRRATYATTANEFAGLFTSAMSILRRRPRPGIDPATIMALLNALLDGAVQRLLVDPTAIDTRLLAEAMVRLGVAFSEHGTYWDPRRSEDPQLAVAFDTLVGEATARFQRGEDVSVGAVAAATGIDAAVAALVFPSTVDLADSVVRGLAQSGGPFEQPGAVHATDLAAMLWRLAAAVDSVPAAVALVTAANGQLTTSCITELRDIAEHVVHRALPSAPARETADALVGFAQRGAAGVDAARPVLRLLGLPADDAAPP